MDLLYCIKYMDLQYIVDMGLLEYQDTLKLGLAIKKKTATWNYT